MSEGQGDFPTELFYIIIHDYMKLYYRSKNKEYAQENRNQYTMTEAE
jgi:hypothetical protein